MGTPDLSEFEELASPNRRRPCAVGSALKLLSDDDQVKAKAAIASPREQIPTGAIEKWFQLRGSKVSIAAITHHRSDRCSCSHGR